MLDKIDSSYKVLVKGPPATLEQINTLTTHFENVPQEYVDLVLEATEIEVQHQGGQYIRIWGPSGCVEMDEGYGIQQRIPGAVPIGDDGGGHVVFYANGTQGIGLYHVGYGNLDLDDAVWIATTLADFVRKATGIDSF
jgi:hypothetical protein